MAEWRQTTSALSRLVSLFHCPICKSSMEDPCVLNSCNHHFCRQCIENALNETQARCPICHVPSWVKDVQSDRQVATLMKCVSSMTDLTMSRSAVQSQREISCYPTTTCTWKEIKASVNCAKPIQRKLKSHRRSFQTSLTFPRVSSKPSPCSERKRDIDDTGSGSALERRVQSQPNICSKEPYNVNTSNTQKTLQKNIRGETALHIAAIKGNVDVMKDLLHQGFNPNVRDNAGWSPLHECCNHGHIKGATLLLDYGAFINAPGFDNDTPLHDAVANGRVEIASLLVARGADVLLRNRHGVVVSDITRTEAMKRAISLPPPPSLLISPNAIVSPYNVPVHSPNGKNIVLLSTGIKSPQKIQLEETAKQLGAKVVESFTTEVTHLVTVTDESKCCPRTLKFLCTVAQGKWIVNFQWVITCHQQGKWVEETPYEVTGIIVRDQFFITEAPRKGRENALLQMPQLFNGCEFFFYGEFVPPHPSKEELVRLVMVAGGSVLSREPRNGDRAYTICPYHAKPGSRLLSSSFISVSSCSTLPLKGKSTTFQVSPTWIFDCLSQFKLMDTDIE